MLRWILLCCLLLPLAAVADEELALGDEVGMDVESSLTETTRKSESGSDTSFDVLVTPTLGGGAYQGAFGRSAQNEFGFGLILEAPVWKMLSVELAGEYARNRIYTGYIQSKFDRFTMGANLKIAIPVSIVRPYAGAGLAAIYNGNMPAGFYTFDRWTGGPVLFMGCDVFLHKQIAIGFRAEQVFSVFNQFQGYEMVPPYTPAGISQQIVNSNFHRLMGTLTIGF